jgi:hypothetical protein
MRRVIEEGYGAIVLLECGHYADRKSLQRHPTTHCALCMPMWAKVWAHYEATGFYYPGDEKWSAGR